MTRMQSFDCKYPWEIFFTATSAIQTLIFALLEAVSKIRKEKNGSDGDYGGEIRSPSFVVIRNAPEMLETVDEPFNNVAFAIMCFIE